MRANLLTVVAVVAGLSVASPACVSKGKFDEAVSAAAKQAARDKSEIARLEAAMGDAIAKLTDEA